MIALPIVSASDVTVASKIPAFPGAEGAGRYSLGGRGGRVIAVTSLADSGPGSLRAAIDAKGPRTIVFRVAGTIRLLSPLRIRNGRVTIAGQTAPGGGITLRDHVLEVSADDVVIRFIRSRLGAESRTQEDAIWINAGHRIILDHVSASWSIDETLSASARYDSPHQGFYDLTVQWSIIADSLRHAGHVKGDHGYGSLIRGGRGARISFHHDLWANHIARMPRPGNYDGPDQDPQGAYFDFRDNVFYNWGGAHSGYDADKAAIVRYNFINNTYIPGPNSTGRFAFDESNRLARAWFAGNAMAGSVPADQWTLVSGDPAPDYRLPGPLPMPAVTTQPAGVAAREVLASAGDSLVRDAVDRRIVAGVRTRTGHVIDNESEDGGWPELAAGRAPRDSDGDGMSDQWEREHALNPHKASDGAAIASNGFTNLENYLAALAEQKMR